MFSEAEAEVMLDFIRNQDKSRLAEQLRKPHSRLFDEYVAQVLEGKNTDNYKKSIQKQKHIAAVVELLPYPKKTIEYPDSIFNLLEPVLNVKASTIRGYYYKHHEFAKGVKRTIAKYVQNDTSLHPTLRSLAQWYLNHMKEIKDKIYPYTPET